MSKGLKVAITGTIGSGKTYVSDIIRKAGYEVFDCDAYNKELLTDAKTIKFIKDKFDCVINDKVDKEKLANIIFNNKTKKAELENYLHPKILEKLLKESENKRMFFAEVPLLFEKNWDKYFDENILVVANVDDIIGRLLLRGLRKEDILNRLNNQMPVELKISKASIIINNFYDLEYLESRVYEIIKELNAR